MGPKWTMGIFALGWVLAAAPVGAQEPGQVRLTATGSVAPGRPPAPPDVRRGDAVWRLYDQAFESLAQADRRRAARLLDDVVRLFPNHPAAAPADAILRRLNEPSVMPGAGVMEATRDGPATAFSRAELAVIQTIHGVVLGGEACALIECNSAPAIGGLLLLGGGAGLAGSLLLSRDGITPGHTAAVNAGTVWGGTLTLNLMLTASDGLERGHIAGIMAGQLLGLGVGHLAWKLTHASAGDVSLASSGGLWLGYLGLMVNLLATGDDGPDGRRITGTFFGAGLGGLVLGGLVAHYVPMSRGRVFVIDGGGIVGTLAGFAVSLLFSAEEKSAVIAPTLGAVAGLGLTAFLTRDWDAPDVPGVTFFVVPSEGGANVGFGGRF